MMLRRVLLMSAVVCFATCAVAQEIAPVAPAVPPATPPQPATPAPPPTDAKMVNKEIVAQPGPTTAAMEAANATSNPSQGELDADKIMAAQKQGYKIKNEDGQILLCRRDLKTGSHARYQVSCLTAREWEQLQKDNEQMLKAIERRPRMTNQ